MRNAVEQLAGLQFELAMAIGSSIELVPMLRATMWVLIESLDARAVAVYEADGTDGSGPLIRVAVVPGTNDLPDRLPAPGDTLPSDHATPDGLFRYRVPLGGFGELLIERGGPEFEPAMVRALRAAGARLGSAARACIEHERHIAHDRRVAHVVAQLRDAVFEMSVTPDGTVTFHHVSDRCLGLLGLSAAALVSDGGSLLESLDGPHREALREALVAAAVTGERLEHRFPINASPPRWIEVSATRDRDGRWFGVFEDATERHIAVAAEGESRRRALLAFADAISDPVVGTDASDHIVCWNHAATALFGHPPQEAIGHHLSLIIPPALREAHARGFARHLETGTRRVMGRSVEMPALHASGREIVVELALNRIDDAGSPLFLAVLRDVTERRRSEERRLNLAAAVRQRADVLVQLTRAFAQESPQLVQLVTNAVLEETPAVTVDFWTVQRTVMELSTSSPDISVLDAPSRFDLAAFPDYRRRLALEHPVPLGRSRQCPGTRRDSDAESLLDFPVRIVQDDEEALIGVLRLGLSRSITLSAPDQRFIDEIVALLQQAALRERQRETDRRHRAVLASISDGIIVCDPHGSITMANPVAAALLGTSVERLLDTALEAVYPRRGDDTPGTSTFSAEALAVAARTQQPRRVVLSRAHGASLPVEETVSTVRPPPGDSLFGNTSGQLGVLGYVIRLRDIRAEEAARQALESRNERLRAIGEALPDLMFTLSRAGQLELMQRESSGHPLLAGLDTTQPFGLTDILDATVSDELTRLAGDALDRNTVTDLTFKHDAHGVVRHYEARAARLSETETILVVRDMTSDREHEAQLASERARLASVLATTAALIYTAAPHTHQMDYVSDSVNTLFGWRPDTYIDNHIWRQAVHPDDLPQVLAALAAYHGDGPLVQEYRHRHRDGSYRWLRDEARWIRDGSGRPVRVVGTAFDITARRRHEEALQTLLHAQATVSRLSREFLAGSSASLQSQIEMALEELGRLTGARGCWVGAIVGDLLRVSNAWYRDGEGPQPDPITGETRELVPYGHTLHELPVLVVNAATDPSTTPEARALCDALDLRRVIGVRMVERSHHGAVLILEEPDYDLLGLDELVAPMQVVADLISAATDRKAQDQSLHHERERLRAVMASTSATIYTARLPSFEIEYVSDSITTVLGFSPSEVMQPGFWERAVHPDDRERVATGLHALFDNGVHVHEYRHRHADGTWRWLHDEVRLVRDEAGETRIAVGASFDVTQKKQDELRVADLLRLQELVSHVSEHLLKAEQPDGDALVVAALAEIGRSTSAPFVCLRLARDGSRSPAGRWTHSGVDPHACDVDAWIDDLTHWLDTDAAAALAGQVSIVSTDAPTTPPALTHLLASVGAQTAWFVELSQPRGFLCVIDPEPTNLPARDLAPLLALLGDALRSGYMRYADDAELRRLNDDASLRLRRQQSLVDLAADLAAASDRDGIFAALERHVRTILPVEACVIQEWGVADDGRVLQTIVDGHGRLPDDLLTLWLDEEHPEWEQTTLGRCITSGAVVVAPDAAGDGTPDLRLVLRHECGGHLLAQPLLVGGRAWGAMLFVSSPDCALDAEATDLAFEVSSLSASHLRAWDAHNELIELNQILEDRVQIRTRELRASEARFQRLFDHAPQLMLIVDEAGRIVQSNERARLVLGPVTRVRPTMALSDVVPAAETSWYSPRPELGRNSARVDIMSGPFDVACANGDTLLAEIGLVSIDLNGTAHTIVGVTDVTERVRALGVVRRSLEEKEILLKEIHHRVKNNLQIVSSLLSMQIARATNDDVREPLAECMLRIQSMALVHQSLYTADSLDHIDLSAYTRTVISRIQSSFAPEARVSLETDSISVGIDTAVPFGLILNELLTNAFKYGVRPGDDAPQITIRLDRVDRRVRLTVSDRGPGMGSAIDTTTTQTLGLHLTRALTRQLRGELTYTEDEGTSVELTYPVTRDAS